jgi:hypothetical protein
LLSSYYLFCMDGRIADKKRAPLICINPLAGRIVSLAVALRIVPEGCIKGTDRSGDNIWSFGLRETKMKLSITLSALLIAGFVAASTEKADALVYCQYVGYPVGCTVRAGVVLRPRPVARAAVTPGVGAAGTPMNRGGPVDRVGRR